MSFDTYETSLESGSPVELYEFALGNEVFYFTNSEDPFTYGIYTYAPVEISRSEVIIGQDERQQLFNITMPAIQEFVRNYLVTSPGQRATLTLYRIHRYDTEPQERHLAFKGIVRSVSFSKQGEDAQIGVMPLTGALGRVFPRFTYQGLCNHVLGDTGCKVDIGSFTYNANVTAITGDQYTVPGLIAKGTGWAIGGFITDQLNREYRLIISQSGDVVRVLLPFPAAIVSVGTSVDVIAGCDHSIGTCSVKFNNVTNYGGFQYGPVKNPFATGL